MGAVKNDRVYSIRRVYSVCTSIADRCIHLTKHVYVPISYLSVVKPTKKYTNNDSTYRL